MADYMCKVEVRQYPGRAQACAQGFILEFHSLSDFPEQNVVAVGRLGPRKIR